MARSLLEADRAGRRPVAGRLNRERYEPCCSPGSNRYADPASKWPSQRPSVPWPRVSQHAGAALRLDPTPDLRLLERDRPAGSPVASCLNSAGHRCGEGSVHKHSTVPIVRCVVTSRIEVKGTIETIDRGRVQNIAGVVEEPAEFAAGVGQARHDNLVDVAHGGHVDLVGGGPQ